MLQRIARTDVNKHSDGLVTLLKLYFDDFISISNDIRHSHLEKLSRAMLHGIHAIFSPPEVTGHTGFDPVAEKKMCDGYSIWDFYKEILGWDLDSIQYTIQFLPKKCIDIFTLMRKLLKNIIVTFNQFQKLAGKLQHAYLGIPRGRSPFTPLNTEMRDNPDFINITPNLRQCLE